MITSEFASYCISALLFMVALPTVLPDNSHKVLVKVQKLETCIEHPDLPHNYMDLHIEMDPEAEILYVSGVLNATEPLEEGITAKVKIFSCITDDRLSCEKYVEIEIDDFCDHLDDKNKTWSPIVSNLENFDPHCPVPPGVYHLRDAPIETSSMDDMYLMSGHWQMDMVVEFKGRLFACLRGAAILSVEENREE